MKDKCVLITGATKGIGWALTQRLSDLGCHVVGIARNTTDVDFPGYLYACDLSDAGRTEEVLREIRDKFPVDAVVNNVGLVTPQPLGEIDLASLYSVLDLNVRVAVQVTQAFVESMKVRRAGRIVNVCSRAIHGGLGAPPIRRPRARWSAVPAPGRWNWPSTASPSTRWRRARSRPRCSAPLVPPAATPRSAHWPPCR